MWCCNRKTLFIFLGIAGVVGLLIATGKINAYAILPFLPFLLCGLMCVVPMLFMGKKGQNDMCDMPQSKSKKPNSSSITDAKS